MLRPRGKRDHMNHDTSYLHSEYARNSMIEQYNREEKEKIKQEVKDAEGGVHASPPAPEKEDDRQNN